jgi:hypothetical protein
MRISGREAGRAGKGERTRKIAERRERRRHDSRDRCPVYINKVLHDRNVVRSSRTLEYVDREVEGLFLFSYRSFNGLFGWGCEPMSVQSAQLGRM